MTICPHRIWMITIALGHLTCAPCAAQEKQLHIAPQNELEAQDVPRLKEVFAPREVEVEILGLKPNEELAGIQLRLVQSMQNNREWFLEHLKSKAETGKPLPYHQNFGITQEEWGRYLELTKELKLVPVSKGRLRFSSNSSNQIVISAVDGLPEFDNIIIDTEHSQVITRWGTVPLDRTVHAKTEAWVGSWDGVSGRIATGTENSDSSSLIRIEIGRLATCAKYFMGLSVRVNRDGVKTVNIETPVRFP